PEAAVPFSLAAVLGTGGRVSATGELVRAPGATKLHAELAALALPPLAALARSPLRLESGNASGAFDIAYGAGGAEASGTLVVADVKTISPDPARPEDVLALKEARLALRQAGSAPPSVAFERVEIDWPYVLVDRSAEGIFPFSLLAATAPAPVERLALPPFNAYLEGASPYTLSSGSVSGKSEITLERSELEVNNQVVLSRLGLNGEPGEDFVKRQLGIPLTLALALMKDYRGDIALGLPFGGNLSEPSFSMRTVVLQGIVQALRG